MAGYPEQADLLRFIREFAKSVECRARVRYG